MSSPSLTDRLVDFTDYTISLLEDPAWMTANNIQAVTYGDQDMIGPVPMICVEPTGKSRTLVGAPRQTEVDFNIYVIIYHGALSATTVTRRAADALAEVVELRLHGDPQCGGLAIHSYVTTLESGSANKGGSLMRATRLTWTARSKVLLPYPGA